MLGELKRTLEEKTMNTCAICYDTGVIETRNNDPRPYLYLPCDCVAGDGVSFTINIGGVTDQIMGAEMKQHFLNSSPSLNCG